MTKFLILFVEDNDAMYDLCNETCIEWNEKHKSDEISFDLIRAKNVSIDYEFLDMYKFQAIITDLRLPIDDDRETAENGSQLAISAIYDRGLPIVIVSGFINEMQDQLADKPYVGRFSKVDGYEPAFDWLKNISEMISVLSAAKSNLETMTSEVFAKRIWPHWSRWKDSENGEHSEKLENTITRQYACQVASFLGTESVASDGWHPFENYVIPPIYNNRSHTGDIFELDGELWIVLSPQCDMATQKIESALLAKCEKGQLNSGWEKYVRNKNSKSLAKLANQNIEKNQHFLPPLPGEETPIFIKFSAIRTMPLKTLNEENLDQRVASISSEFLGNMVQRFGSYISRTGQPNLNMSYYFSE